MLRDGQFFREPPVVIGSAYTPPLRNDFTPEEYFIQEVLLGGRPKFSLFEVRIPLAVPSI